MKIKYNEISTFAFQTAMQKLSAAPVDGRTAYDIKLMNSALKKAREQVADEYKKEIIEVYAKRDENGKYNEEQFEPQEEKLKEFEAAQEAFGEREIEIDRPMFTAHHIQSVKLSALELEGLGQVFDFESFEKPLEAPRKIR